MGAPYSHDLRERVLAAVDGEMSKKTACEMFRIAHSTLDDWLALRAATGSLAAKSGYHKGRARVLGDPQSFENFAHTHRHKTLEQMARVWQEETGHKVSRNTFSVMLRALGWTHKKELALP